MANKKKKLIGGLILTIALVIMITITYATFNKTLTINGAGVVRKQSWDVHLDDTSLQMTSSGAAVVTTPSINGTTISNYQATFKSPGDAAVFDFEIKNTGTFKAVVSSVTIPTPIVTGSGSNKAADEANVLAKLTYTLKNEDGTPVAVGQEISPNGGVQHMTLELKYNNFDDPDLLPVNDVQITNLAVTVTYQEAF